MKKIRLIFKTTLLTLFNLNYHNVAQDVAQGVAHDGTHKNHINNIEEKITNLIKRDPNITQSEMANAIGVSLKTIKRYTSLLKRIKYVGSGNKGHWEVVGSKD